MIFSLFVYPRSGSSLAGTWLAQNPAWARLVHRDKTHLSLLRSIQSKLCLGCQGFTAQFTHFTSSSLFRVPAHPRNTVSGLVLALPLYRPETKAFCFPWINPMRQAVFIFNPKDLTVLHFPGYPPSTEPWGSSPEIQSHLSSLLVCGMECGAISDSKITFLAYLSFERRGEKTNLWRYILLMKGNEVAL